MATLKKIWAKCERHPIEVRNQATEQKYTLIGVYFHYAVFADGSAKDADNDVWNSVAYANDSATSESLVTPGVDLTKKDIFPKDINEGVPIVGTLHFHDPKPPIKASMWKLNRVYDLIDGSKLPGVTAATLRKYFTEAKDIMVEVIALSSNFPHDKEYK